MKKLLAIFCTISLLASCSTNQITDKNIAMFINETPIYIGEYIYNYNYITNYFLEETSKSLDSFTRNEAELIGEKAREQVLFLFTIKKLAQDNNIILSDADNEYIKNSLDVEIKSFDSLDVFIKALKSIGLTMEKYKEISESGLLYDKISAFYFGADSENPITEQSLKSSFSDDYYHVKHILINKAEDGHSADDGHGHSDLKTQEEAKLLAQDIYEKIQANEDFDKLMNEYGEDPDVARNPDGYHFKKGAAVAEFEEASLSLKENEISDIIETDFGFHIIKRLPINQDFFIEHKDDLIKNEINMAMDKLIDEAILGYDIILNDIIKKITPANADSYIK